MTRLTAHALAACALLACLPASTAPPNPSSVYRIPYRLTDTKHLLVRARINDRGPFNFIVDTGAPALFMSTDAAKKAGVERTEDGWGTCDRVLIEGGALAEKVQARIDEPAQLRAMNAIGLPGARVDGVLGYTLLARFRIEIDLTQPEMVWTRLDYTPAELVPVKIDLPEGQAPPEAPMGVRQMEGLATLASVLIRKQAEKSVVLRGFFGMELADVKDQVRIRAVLPESPAARGGLRASDRITAVTLKGGKPERVVNSAGLLRRMSTVPAGFPVRFTVTRGAKSLLLLVEAGKGGL